ncbi:unnamed protein product [Caenorhabditis sp. 36 PRJEB53466]|nr:unnamed protein product [Caenorhabditis sp. 36 PRJEB53466]
MSVFKEYNEKERTGIEPKHVELIEFDDEEEDDDSLCGRAFERQAGDERTVKKLISAVYIEGSTEKSRSTSNCCWIANKKGDENWATPSISNVRDMLDCGI